MSDPVRELKQELLSAAERRPADANRSHSRRNRVLLTAAALTVAAVVTLVVSAPWASSPGFLQKAEAALTGPAGSILHYRWEMTRTSTEFGCTVSSGPNETWVDQRPPHRFHAIVPVDPALLTVPATSRRTLACADWGTAEIGGNLGGFRMLRFVPPGKVVESGDLIPVTDPVASLRDAMRAAIAEGRAHHEGKTELDGRIVERIRLDPRSGCGDQPCRLSTYVYVEPETLFPVQSEGPPSFAYYPYAYSVTRFHVVERYLKYEYLPRTAANRALTDIRAQHPEATGP
jgi:hypothetical protein